MDPQFRFHGSGDVSKGWGNAVRREGGRDGRLGYWGMDLAKHLVESQKIPICIINGAVGGTRIDQHMPNPANRDGSRPRSTGGCWRASSKPG